MSIPEPTFRPIDIDVETCKHLAWATDGAIVHGTMAWRRFNPAFTLAAFATLIGVAESDYHRVKKRLGGLLADMGYSASQETWQHHGRVTHPRVWRVRAGADWRAGGVPPFAPEDSLETLVTQCSTCGCVVVTKDHDCPTMRPPAPPFRVRDVAPIAEPEAIAGTPPAPVSVLFANKDGE